MFENLKIHLWYGRAALFLYSKDSSSLLELQCRWVIHPKEQRLPAFCWYPASWDAGIEGFWPGKVRHVQTVCKRARALCGFTAQKWSRHSGAIGPCIHFEWDRLVSATQASHSQQQPDWHLWLGKGWFPCQQKLCTELIIWANCTDLGVAGWWVLPNKELRQPNGGSGVGSLSQQTELSDPRNWQMARSAETVKEESAIRRRSQPV